MDQHQTPTSGRVKFVYNAQFPSSAAIVLDYLLHNMHFTSRQGRQQGMDAMMAFYRPMAEEVWGNASEEEVKAIAQHSVEQLAKHIDFLCSRYGIEPPIIGGQTPATPRDLGRLEAVLEKGLQAISEALQTASISTMQATTSALIDVEQGVVMDGDELGDLAKFLGDADLVHDALD